MRNLEIHRRQLLLTAAAATTIPLSPQAHAGGQVRQTPTFRYCLNTSTINGSEVPVEQQIAIASAAGYDGVELWLRDIDKFVSGGGKLSDLRLQLEDANLRLESAIAFGAWAVDDPQQRQAGLEQCGRDMEVVRELGGRRIAAPPAGATQPPQLDLGSVVDRYRALLEVGMARDVSPQLEVWGFSANFSRLAEVLYVAAAVDHPQALILPDVYHLYKGGSDFNDLQTLGGGVVEVLHMNDYPAHPPRAEIADADRVFPGDGVAPISAILQTMVDNGFSGVLSLELFNRGYWKRPAEEVASEGLAKMKAAVENAFANPDTPGKARG